MANPHRGEFTLKSGNVVYTLAVDYDILCQIEHAIGKGMPAIMADLGNPATITLTNVRTICLLLLKRRHPEITELQAGELIAGAGGAIKVIEIMFQAIKLAFNPDDEDATANPQKPSQSTGSIGLAH